MGASNATVAPDDRNRIYKMITQYAEKHIILIDQCPFHHFIGYGCGLMMVYTHFVNEIFHP